jgi:hypothetical protein
VLQQTKDVPSILRRIRQVRASVPDWYNLMQTELATALELETRIQQFMSDYIAPYIAEQRYPNLACDKLLAVVGGWADLGTRLRWPYRFIPETEARPVRDAGRRLIPEFFVTNKTRVRHTDR